MEFPFRPELVLLIFLFPNSIQTGWMVEKHPHAKESTQVHRDLPQSFDFWEWFFSTGDKSQLLVGNCKGFFCPFVRLRSQLSCSTSSYRVLLLKQRVRHTWQWSQKTQWRWPSHHTADTTLSRCDRSISSDTPETVYPRSVRGRTDAGRAGRRSRTVTEWQRGMSRRGCRERRKINGRGKGSRFGSR